MYTRYNNINKLVGKRSFSFRADELARKGLEKNNSMASLGGTGGNNDKKNDVEDPDEEEENVLEKKKRRQKKIVDDFKRGYFYELNEIKKDPLGKVTQTSTELINAKGAVKFPFLECESLEGKPTNLGNFVIHPNRLTLVAICFREHGAQMLPEWITAFNEDNQCVKKEYRKYVEQVAIQINAEDRWFYLNMMQKVIKKGLKNVIEKDRHDKTFLYFGDALDIRDDLDCDNRLVGHILLVDQAGKVRWRASGAPCEDDIVNMLRCKLDLIQEYEDALDARFSKTKFKPRPQKTYF